MLDDGKPPGPSIVTGVSKAGDQLVRGNLLYAAGDLKQAAAAYRTATLLDPANADAHNLLAWACYRMGKVDEGLSEVQQALRIKPSDPVFINTLASLLFDKGELFHAELNFQKAVSLSNPPNAADFYGAAVCALASKNTTAAVRMFEQALKCDAQYSDVSYLCNQIGFSENILRFHDALVKTWDRTKGSQSRWMGLFKRKGS